jgi:formylmethanofuran dehydrogenase subunit E
MKEGILTKKCLKREIEDNICSYTFDEYCGLIESFHGYVAPGVIIGGFMVELAYRNLPETMSFNVICETAKCLPDAIQLLTRCTVGNHRLVVFDIGRYAVTFYDTTSGEGIRVYVDHGKLEKWSEFYAWFLKLKPKKLQDTQLLLSQIKEAGTGVYQVKKVQVLNDFLKKSPDSSRAVCLSCNEVYRVENGESICPECSNNYLPY